MKSGYTLIEVLISAVILVLAIIPLLLSFMWGIKTVQFHGDNSKATQLARDLLEEIKGKRWDENTPASGVAISTATASPIGREAGEVANNKTTFDDIDDYGGGAPITDPWNEGTPKDLNNNPISGCDRFTRTVEVRYVTIPDTDGDGIPDGDNPAAPAEFVLAGNGLGTGGVNPITNFKLIKVTVSWEHQRAIRTVEMETVRANVKH